MTLSEKCTSKFDKYNTKYDIVMKSVPGSDFTVLLPPSPKYSSEIHYQSQRNTHENIQKKHLTLSEKYNSKEAEEEKWFHV